jgi:hypothetical protein
MNSQPSSIRKTKQNAKESLQQNQHQQRQKKTIQVYQNINSAL